MDAMVEADPERLATMVEHLIRNAQDATARDGMVRVEVSVERGVELEPLGVSGIRAVTPQQLVAAASQIGVGDGPSPGLPGDYARLAVEDTGSGMTPEFVKERLFKPFDTTKGSKGMGIGAYQVREYVTGLGGRVKVDTAPGRGTTFALWLPLRTATTDGGQA
jgi:signal transduction histidine kinase